MGTTPNFDLPYPEPTDLARNGALAIRALAETIETRINYDASLTIAPAESSSVTNGSVEFPGSASMGGFTYSAGYVTYTGGGSRFFVVSACVEVWLEAPGGVNQMQSSLSLVQNGTAVATSRDLVNVNDVLQARVCTHTLSVPVQMGDGDTLVFFTDSNPLAGTIGLTSLRVYPMGPRLP